MLNHQLIQRDGVGRLVATITTTKVLFNGGTPVDDAGRLVVKPLLDSAFVPAATDGMLYDAVTQGLAVANTAASVLAPALTLDFTTGALDSKVAVGRTAVGTYWDVNGQLQTAAANVARFTYDPNRPTVRGLLSECARTQSIKNSTGAGGTSSAVPTWVLVATTGMTWSFAFGTEDGIPYIDISIDGTNSSGGASSPTIRLRSGTADNPIVSPGQVAITSCYMRSIRGTRLPGFGGAFRNGAAFNRQALLFINSGPDAAPSITGDLTGGVVYYGKNAASGKLRDCRYELINTPTGTDTNSEALFVFSSIPNGASIAETCRLGCPQLEVGIGFNSRASYPMLSTNAFIVRDAEALTMTGTNFSSWYNATEGSFVQDGLLIDQGDFAVTALEYTVSDGTLANVLSPGITLSSLLWTGTKITASVDQGAIDYRGMLGAFYTATKVGCSYKLNQAGGSINAAPGNDDITYSVLTANKFTFMSNGVSSYSSGVIYGLKYWNTGKSSLALGNDSSLSIPLGMLNVTQDGTAKVAYNGTPAVWYAGLPLDINGNLCIATPVARR